MKSGYDQFFKNARKNAAQGQPVAARSSQKANPVKPQRQFVKTGAHFESAEEELERQLKARLGMPPRPKKRRKSVPWKLMGVSFLGLLVTGWGAQNFEEVEAYIKRVEVSFLGSAFAEEKKTAAKDEKAAPKEGAEKSAGKDGEKSADAKEGSAPAEAVAKKEGSGLTDGEIDHLSKLNDRKKELDDKEEELARIELELQTQKEELEKRLKDLDGMRRGISSVLEEKVKVDEKKLDTLVLIYSDMKAQQAAKVFETMDEDLAVGILGRMKKKNAADIMTLLKSEKAQVLTEKFAGYKRK